MKIEDTTIRVKVGFERRTIGKFAGQWVGPAGRGGSLNVAFEGSGQTFEQPPGTITETNRTEEREADDDLPAYTLDVKTVYVHVPWRSAGLGWRDGEREQVCELIKAHVGPHAVQ